MDWPLQSERTALIVVDMQNGFCHPEGSLQKSGLSIAMCEAAVAPCRRLIDAAHAADVPVVYLQVEWRRDRSDAGVIFREVMGGVLHESALLSGTWDAQIVDELKPTEADYLIHKNRFSGFYGTRLEPLLRSLGIENLVVCGVTTNMCVETTVRDAAQRDFRCFVVADAVGEVDRDVHEGSLKTLGFAFAKVVGGDEVVTAFAGVPATA